MMVAKMKAIRVIVARFRQYKLRRYLMNLVDKLKYDNCNFSVKKFINFSYSMISILILNVKIDH